MWKKKYIQQFITFDNSKLPPGCNVATITIFLKIKKFDENKSINLHTFYNNVNVKSKAKHAIKYIEYEDNLKSSDFQKKKSKKKKIKFSK